jgi:hypothetical protein
MYENDCEFADDCPCHRSDSFTCSHFGGPYCGAWRRFHELNKDQKKFFRLKSFFFGFRDIIKLLIQNAPHEISELYHNEIVSEEALKH